MKLDIRNSVFATTLLISSAAQADFGDYVDHRLNGARLEIETTAGLLSLTAVDDAALEVHYVENKVEQLPSFAIGEPLPKVDATLSTADSTLTFSIDGLAAKVSKHPVRISFERDGAPLVAEEYGYFAYDTVRGFRFQLNPTEKIMGGGERVLGMNRRGQRMPLYNRAHYGYETESSQMYYSLPAIMSSERYMIIFDNTASGWLDIDYSEPGILQFDAVAGRTAYIVVAGETYPDLIGNFTDVTGRQPLPPRWAFGNFASRFGYHTEDETRDVVRRFREADIPLDAIVLDIYWFGPDIKSHMGNLDWDRNAWPDPEGMIRDFADLGVKTIAITEPFILTTSTKWQDAVDNGALARNAAGNPKRFNFYFGNTGIVDIFNEGSRAWFWSHYRRLFDIGIAGTWGDLGEPEVHPGDTLHWLSDVGTQATGDAVHNAYGHEWTRMVYENRVRDYPDRRPLILMRSGFVGTQRYGVIPWTGDVNRTWGGLKPQVELSLQMGLFGLAYTHSDLGGFAGGESFDSELYRRWLQYGVFQPVYRPHAQEHIAPEPVFHDEDTRRIVRDAIRLRYQLMPYIYTLAWENSTGGMPLMRPVFFEDEDDLSLIDEKGAYFWGDAFLVAPVTDPGVSAIPLQLPDGVWLDFWTGERYQGGREVAVPVTMETIPVLVRAGSFVPMTNVVSSTDDYSSESLAVHYYADSSVTTASGRMYEDDGRNPGSLESGAYELLAFGADDVDDVLELSLRRDGGEYPGMPAVRDLTLVIHNWQKDVSRIRIGKRAAARKEVEYDPDQKRLTIRFDWDHRPTRISIR